jgi:rSAM/selenodomain-associated transferase 2
MISVIIPALNAAKTIRAAVEQVKSGLVQEIIVVDGGSKDATAEIARAAGATVIESKQGRGAQLKAGAEAAQGEWLLFLHADTRLGPGWESEVANFMAEPNNRLRGAVFRFVLDDDSEEARRLERLVAWRNRALDLPYGDQGLLIHRVLYRVVGGFEPLPLMEDVNFMRRLNGRFRMLETPAITSADRYRRDGYFRRSARNFLCLGLYLIGVPPHKLVRLYG